MTQCSYYMLKRLCCLVMRHSFNLDDMGHRETSGYLHWPCFRCGKDFVVSCGLDILDYGQIIPPPTGAKP